MVLAMGMQTNAKTPNNVRMCSGLWEGLLPSCFQHVNAWPSPWRPYLMCVRAAPAILKELRTRIQHCCAMLRRSWNKRNVGRCWFKSLTSFKLRETTPNNIQHGVQTFSCQEPSVSLWRNVSPTTWHKETEGSGDENGCANGRNM